MKGKIHTPEYEQLTFCHCGRFDSKRMIAEHHHPANEIIFVKRGHCVNYIGDTVLEAKNGDVLILPAGIPHSQKNVVSTETLFVTFYNGPDLFKKTPLLVKTRDDVWVSKWFDDICLIHEKLLKDCENLIIGVLFSLLTRLETLAMHTHMTNNLPAVVAQAVFLLDKNFNKDISIEEIARKCGISAGYFSVIFHRSVGMSPLIYLNKLRMTLAIKLLKNSFLNIAEVAQRCGYNNANYFTRHFKATFGCTPSDYRKLDTDSVKEGVFSEKFHYIWDQKGYAGKF
jgi:AraC-like DNA-binding protein/mannose-6-phosphate isomerase-like protein (cupin superfamily)